MKYKIVTSGKTNFVTLDQISRNLKVQSDVFILSDKEIYLGSIYNKTLVFFATEFADYALQNYEKERLPEAEECIALVRKWIEDNTSVSNEELRAAANAADAANAAYAAYAAYAAASASSYTHAAAYVAGVDREKEFIRQGNFILDFLKSGKNLFLV